MGESGHLGAAREFVAMFLGWQPPLAGIHDALAAIEKAEARIDVEVNLRRAAYERIETLEARLAELRAANDAAQNWVDEHGAAVPDELLYLLVNVDHAAAVEPGDTPRLPPHDHTIEPGEINRRGCERCEQERLAALDQLIDDDTANTGRVEALQRQLAEAQRHRDINLREATMWKQAHAEEQALVQQLQAKLDEQVEVAALARAARFRSDEELTAAEAEVERWRDGYAPELVELAERQAENERLRAALAEMLDLIVIDANGDGATIPIQTEVWGPVWERARAALAGGVGDTAA